MKYLRGLVAQNMITYFKHGDRVLVVSASNSLTDLAALAIDVASCNSLISRQLNMFSYLSWSSDTKDYIILVTSQIFSVSIRFGVLLARSMYAYLLPGNMCSF